jgi:hypothetical protein
MFVIEDDRAEALERSIIMVSDISKRLAGLLGDFAKGVTLKEVQLESGGLLGRKCFS